MTATEKAYKKYDDLNKEIQNMVKQLHESKNALQQKKVSESQKQKIHH